MEKEIKINNKFGVVNSIKLFSCVEIQFYSIQFNSTQLNSTQLNSTQLNSIQLNSMQCLECFQFSDFEFLFSCEFKTTILELEFV